MEMIKLKPMVFNKSVEEIELQLLTKLKEKNLNDRIIVLLAKLTMKEYWEKRGFSLRYDTEEKKILLSYCSIEGDICFGEITFDGTESTISSVKINMYDSKDIKEFEKIRLRMLFS